MIFIKIKNQFIKTHCWKDAPKEVEFLRHPHRHVFYVTSQIEVFEDDREIEYFMAQRVIDKIIKDEVMEMEEGSSCEMFAEKILDFLELVYPNRFIEIEVSEDNENSSIINNT